MTRVKRLITIARAALIAVWGLVRRAFALGRRHASVSHQRLNAVRRRYALGAASREQFDAALRDSGPAERWPLWRRPRSKKVA